MPDEIKPVRERSSVAAFVNAVDQPLLGAMIIGAFLTMELLDKQPSATLILILGAVVNHFFRPKEKPADKPKAPAA